MGAAIRSLLPTTPLGRDRDSAARLDRAAAGRPCGPSVGASRYGQPGRRPVQNGRYRSGFRPDHGGHRQCRGGRLEDSGDGSGRPSTAPPAAGRADPRAGSHLSGGRSRAGSRRRREWQRLLGNGPHLPRADGEPHAGRGPTVTDGLDECRGPPSVACTGASGPDAKPDPDPACQCLDQRVQWRGARSLRSTRHAVGRGRLLRRDASRSRSYAAGRVGASHDLGSGDHTDGPGLDQRLDECGRAQSPPTRHGRPARRCPHRPGVAVVDNGRGSAAGAELPRRPDRRAGPADQDSKTAGHRGGAGANSPAAPPRLAAIPHRHPSFRVDGDPGRRGANHRPGRGRQHRPGTVDARWHPDADCPAEHPDPDIVRDADAVSGGFGPADAGRNGSTAGRPTGRPGRHRLGDTDQASGATAPVEGSCFQCGDRDVPAPAGAHVPRISRGASTLDAGTAADHSAGAGADPPDTSRRRAAGGSASNDHCRPLGHRLGCRAGGGSGSRGRAPGGRPGPTTPAADSVPTARQSAAAHSSPARAARRPLQRRGRRDPAVRLERNRPSMGQRRRHHDLGRCRRALGAAAD
jgi:hypothetical protein